MNSPVACILFFGTEELMGLFHQLAAGGVIPLAEHHMGAHGGCRIRSTESRGTSADDEDFHVSNHAVQPPFLPARAHPYPPSPS